MSVQYKSNPILFTASGISKPTLSSQFYPSAGDKQILWYRAVIPASRDSLHFGNTEPVLELTTGPLSKRDSKAIESVWVEAVKNKAPGGRLPWRERRHLRDFCKLYLAASKPALVVARNKGKEDVVAFGFLNFDYQRRDTLILRAVGVLPGHKGLGKTIIDQLCQYARENAQKERYRRIVLHPRNNQLQLIEYYRGFGFELIPPGEYPEPGYMQLLL